MFGTVAVVVAVPILVEPTLSNVVTLVASVGLGLAFALKDYGSSLLAGLATVLENTYQPGDWIQVEGTYGEVKSIDSRAVRIVTADDTEVIVPHSKLWSTRVSNATSGNRSLLCVADFYLHPDHDAAAAQRRLTEVAGGSSYRKADTAVSVIVHEQPWGTHYRLKIHHGPDDPRQGGRAGDGDPVCPGTVRGNRDQAGMSFFREPSARATSRSGW